MSTRLRPFSLATAAALTVTLLALSPAPAAASPETLRRSVGNLIQAPLDMLLAPIVAGRTLYQNMRDIDDTPAVRVVYALPGYAWLTGLHVGAGALRGIAGALELLPGLILLPLETDLDPIYDPAETGGALVEVDNPLAEIDSLYYVPLVTWNVKFGIRYTGAEY